MSTETITFFGGDPAILEKPVPGREESELHVVDSVYYIFSDGDFSLYVQTSGNVLSYDTVLYEDIKQEEDGTISFEFQGSERRIRPITDEDGSFIMQYEMPFPARAIKELIKVEGSSTSPIRQTVEALVDEETGEVQGFIYNISKLGLFFRSNGEWDIPTPEMLETLETSNSIPLSMGGAKKVVREWDEGNKMNVSDLEDYRISEQ